MHSSGWQVNDDSEINYNLKGMNWIKQFSEKQTVFYKFKQNKCKNITSSSKCIMKNKKKLWNCFYVYSIIMT